MEYGTDCRTVRTYMFLVQILYRETLAPQAYCYFCSSTNLRRSPGVVHKATTAYKSPFLSSKSRRREDPLTSAKDNARQISAREGQLLRRLIAGQLLVRASHEQFRRSVLCASFTRKGSSRRNRFKPVGECRYLTCRLGGELRKLRAKRRGSFKHGSTNRRFRIRSSCIRSNQSAGVQPRD